MPGPLPEGIACLSLPSICHLLEKYVYLKSPLKQYFLSRVLLGFLEKTSLSLSCAHKPLVMFLLQS